MSNYVTPYEVMVHKWRSCALGNLFKENDILDPLISSVIYVVNISGTREVHGMPPVC